MKRIRRKTIEQNIKKLNTSLADYDYINDCLIKSSLVRFLISIFLFVYSLVFEEKISKLAIITADTILNHEVHIEPDIYYFTVLGILSIGSLLVLVISLILIRFAKSSYVKRILKFFKAYDLIGFIFTILVLINFIIMFIITPVTINGDSMENTFSNNDKVLIWHFIYEPDNEDVIILDAKEYSYDNKDVFYIKRIVAKGNDILTIKQKDGFHYELYRNDIYLETITIAEWLIITKYEMDELKFNYQIPEGRYLLLGDNRKTSYDGRKFGLVDKEDVLGKVILRYYPFRDFGFPNKNIRN